MVVIPMPGTWDQMVPRLPCSTEPFSSETQRQLASSSKTELTSTVPPDLPVPPARVWTECLVLRSRACSLHRYTWAVRGGSRRWFSVWLITMPMSMPRCVCGGVGNGHLLISATICKIQPCISLSLSAFPLSLSLFLSPSHLLHFSSSHLTPFHLSAPSQPFFSLSQDSTGRTALHVSISCKQPRCSDILLLHPNLDLTVRDKSGNTPFAMAMSVKDTEAGQAILNREPKAAEQVSMTSIFFIVEGLAGNSNLVFWPSQPPN